MLFKQEDLGTDSIQEAANILSESVYLAEEESQPSAVTIPVVENARIGANVVNLEDIHEFAEKTGLDYIGAAHAVAEANNIDYDHLAVAVDEADIVADPSLVNEIDNVVIKNNSNVWMDGFCEAVINLYVESDGDEELAEAFFEDAQLIQEEDDAAAPAAPADPDAGKSTFTRVNNIMKHYDRMKDYDRGDDAAVDFHNANMSNDLKAIMGDNPSLGQKIQYYAAKALSFLRRGKNFVVAKAKDAYNALKKQYDKLINWANKVKDDKKANIIKKVAAWVIRLLDKVLSKIKSAGKSVYNGIKNN